MNGKQPGDERPNSVDAIAQLREEYERQRQQYGFERTSPEAYYRAAAGLLDELVALDYNVIEVGGLIKHYEATHRPYTDAVPVLLRWLPHVNYPPLREDIVRTLTVPWARDAVPVLVSEFRKPDICGIRWVIANALAVLADDSAFDEIADLAADSNYGKSREMLALALGNMNDPRAILVLIALLDDEVMVGHATIALGRRRAREAREQIESIASNDPRAWVRKEARKALASIG